jgi:hypothetical protein
VENKNAKTKAACLCNVVKRMAKVLFGVKAVE